MYLQRLQPTSTSRSALCPSWSQRALWSPLDIVRRPDDDAPQGAAIVKKADEIDAATIVICPHQQDFSEVTPPAAVPMWTAILQQQALAPAQWAHVDQHAATGYKQDDEFHVLVARYLN